MILVIDGTNLWCQSAHLVDWSDPHAEGAAMHIAVRTLAKVVREARPTSVNIAWDSDTSDRKLFCSTYKASRKEAPVQKHSEAFVLLMEQAGADQWLLAGAEADDLIAWMWKTWSPDHDGRIWSGDKDLLQLVGRWDQVRPDKVWTTVEVKAKYGVGPEHLPLWFALAGDTIDGVSGVPHVGKKRATEILQEVEQTTDVVHAVLQDRRVIEHRSAFWEAWHLVDLRHDPLHIQARAVEAWGLPEPSPWDPEFADAQVADLAPVLGLTQVTEQAERRALFTPPVIESASRNQMRLGIG